MCPTNQLVKNSGTIFQIVPLLTLKRLTSEFANSIQLAKASLLSNYPIRASVYFVIHALLSGRVRWR
jgi:hypothetical protein